MMKFIETYFSCFRAAGINTIFEIHRLKGSKLIEAHSFDHVTHDGISAVLDVARKFPEEGFHAPALTLKPKPSLSKRLYELAKWYVSFWPFMPPKWKTFSNKVEADVVSGVVEIENWRSDDSAISVNTKLLYALDKTSLDYLTNSKRPRVWMTPVGMYNGVSRDLEPSNRVSFIDLKITSNASLSEIQEDAKRQLKELNYWGTILTMYFSVIFGKTFFILFSRYLHLFFRRTGTFSNMGEWKVAGLHPDEWWTFGRGCVAKMSPVEGTAIVVNGRMGISVHFHSELGIDQSEAQRFVEKWKENFISLNRSHS